MKSPPPRLGPDVEILTISMDLPFAQKRWCRAAGVDPVKTYSDHRDAAFGEAYGVLIKELRLLARAVFVVDKGGVLRYVQLVKELFQEPSYRRGLAGGGQADLKREIPISIIRRSPPGARAFGRPRR